MPKDTKTQRISGLLEDLPGTLPKLLEQLEQAGLEGVVVAGAPVEPTAVSLLAVLRLGLERARELAPPKPAHLRVHPFANNTDGAWPPAPRPSPEQIGVGVAVVDEAGRVLASGRVRSGHVDPALLELRGVFEDLDEAFVAALTLAPRLHAAKPLARTRGTTINLRRVRAARL